jgi:hypothetical protein
MIGTSAAFLTTNLIAPNLLGGQTPAHVATAAAIVGTTVAVGKGLYLASRVADRLA